MKIVCVRCQCEFRPETNGTTVVEMAQSEPYKVWHADTWKCPGCGVEVVSGFAQKPLIQQGDESFDKRVQSWLEKARRVVYDYERPVK